MYPDNNQNNNSYRPPGDNGWIAPGANYSNSAHPAGYTAGIGQNSYQPPTNTASDYSYLGYDATELYGQSLYGPQTAPRMQTGYQPGGGTPPKGTNEKSTTSSKHKPGGWNVRRLMAGALAVVMLSAVSGGGAAWLVLETQSPSITAAEVTAQNSFADTTSSSSSDSSGLLQTAADSNSSAGTGSLSSVVKKAAGSVVEITTETVSYSFFAGDYVTDGAGSGVILTSDGYIATNHHVIDGASNVAVRTEDGTEYAAVLVGTDSRTDLAVIKIEAEGLTPVTLADSDALEVGDVVVAIGNPLGQLGGTVTNGIVSAKDRDITIDGDTMTLLQTSAAVNPGNSGGGLFDESGNLVGIVNAKSSGTDIEGLAFAIPSNTVKEVVNDIIENGYVTGRPQLGIRVVNITDLRTAARYGLGSTGVYVGEALLDNGLQAKDLIVEIDGKTIESTADITEVLSQHQVGDSLQVVVERDGEEVTLRVVLTEQVPEELQELQQAQTDM